MEDLDDTELDDRLAEWQFHYNRRRSQGTLAGRTPMEVACDLQDTTSLWDDMHAPYDQSKERIQERNYQLDLRMRSLQECP